MKLPAAVVRTKLRPTAMFYQPRTGLLVLKFPRAGAYLFRNVTGAAYKLLRNSACAAACPVENEGRHYSIVKAR